MKNLSVLLAVSVTFLLMSGCQNGKTEKSNRADSKQSGIVTNELEIVKSCREFVKAQEKYSYMARIDDSATPYEMKNTNENVENKGLSVENKDGKPKNPVTQMLSAAAADRANKSLETPYNGYLIQVLIAQGETAPGGENDSSTGGSLTKGFALLAYPAKYGETGVLTFVVSHLGVIYEKDLGEKTSEVAPKINEYSLDDTWTPVSKN